MWEDSHAGDARKLAARRSSCWSSSNGRLAAAAAPSQRQLLAALLAASLVAFVALNSAPLATVELWVRQALLSECNPASEAAVDAGPFSRFSGGGWVASANSSSPGPVDFVTVTALPGSLRLSVATICHFAAPGLIATWHFVVPDRMEAYFLRHASVLGCGGSTVKVWRESAIVPAFTDDAPYRGTTRQMLLKLAAAAVVRTPYYLVLDTDVYARRPFGVDDLFSLQRGGPDGGARWRARANMDQTDKFTQPAAWLSESARVLRTPLMANSAAYCAHVTTLHGGAPYLARAREDDPFRLISDERAGGAAVIGACHSGRPWVTHVTPALLRTEVVTGVLAPRLEAFTGGDDDAQSALPPAGPRWHRALLDFHDATAARCRQALGSGRFYTWTEYGLYFVAAAASGALGDFHAFGDGDLTSIRHSVMTPAQWDAREARDWDAAFTDAADGAPLFIVHSWFGRPLELLAAHFARSVPSLQAGASAWSLPAAPSPEPLFGDRARGH